MSRIRVISPTDGSAEADQLRQGQIEGYEERGIDHDRQPAFTSSVFYLVDNWMEMGAMPADKAEWILHRILFGSAVPAAIWAMRFIAPIAPIAELLLIIFTIGLVATHIHYIRHRHPMGIPSVIIVSASYLISAILFPSLWSFIPDLIERSI